MKKWISLILCLVLLVPVAAAAVDTAPPQIVWDQDGQTILLKDRAEYGQGEKTFALAVCCGSECAAVTVNTDAETVGAALLELNIVAGEEGQYGLYVKTVNGITADYSVDGTYWAFYIDGEYAMTGVDATPIHENSVYLLKVEGRELNEDETVTLSDGKNYGLGSKCFVLEVAADAEAPVTVTVRTDAGTVGEALLALQIIAGEDGDYGLYVKTVNGVTADYSRDAKYWAFYIDGEYAMTGVDATEINENAVYTLRIEG